MTLFRNAFVLIFSLVALVWLYTSSQFERSQPCSQAWFDGISKRTGVIDAQGHGPDPGSLEWRSAVEKKLKLPAGSKVSELASDQWCKFIDDYMH
ncbi:MAG: hypothetical protein AAF431_12815 [Pseudomonadota bacterium]